METRFDDTQNWRPRNDGVHNIESMETAHIMNTLRMFANKPDRTEAMLVEDIEQNTYAARNFEPWSPNKRKTENDVKAQSLYAITSMTETELIDFALQSPLGFALRDELEKRGVNMETFIQKIMKNVKGENENE